ncbi:hypothetical protein H6B15_12260, partial [Gemmiger formicilis]|uniref:hypothetical protein n=1 Tax=Gemmiger formicilis TaxID=745368 RepID=UPI00195B7A4E
MKHTILCAALLVLLAGAAPFLCLVLPPTGAVPTGAVPTGAAPVSTAETAAPASAEPTPAPTLD